MAERIVSRWFCALALLFGVAVGFYATQRGYTITHDDAYISFRYAANAIAGRGLVFNPGERVWGFTSPLQTLLLAALGAFGIDIPKLSLALALLWISLAACLLRRLSRHGFADCLPGIVVALCALTYGEGYSYLGLETNLLLVLEVLFLHLLVEGHPRWAAAVGSLACLARPDAIILVAPALLMTREGRRLPSLAVFLAPGLLWLAFAWGYYGDLLPNTFYAKRASTKFATFIVEISRWITDPLGTADSPVTGPWPVWRRLGSWLLFLASLLPALNRHLRKYHALLYALVGYPWALTLAYGLVGAPTTHRWEYFAAFFFLRLSAVIGLLSLPEILAAARPRLALTDDRRRRLRVAVAAPLVLLAAWNARECFLRLDREQENGWYGRRFRDYSAVARYINENLPRGETLLLLEVGILGYLTDMRVIDMAGLTTKGFRSDNLPDYLTYLRRYRPRYALIFGNVGSLNAGDLHYRSVYFLDGVYGQLSLMAQAG